jgi:hypothetical protein
MRPESKNAFAFFSCFGSDDPHHPPTGMSNLIRDETREELKALRLWWRKRGALFLHEKMFSTE